MAVVIEEGAIANIKNDYKLEEQGVAGGKNSYQLIIKDKVVFGFRERAHADKMIKLLRRTANFIVTV